jgi:hypothetical protein
MIFKLLFGLYESQNRDISRNTEEECLAEAMKVLRPEHKYDMNKQGQNSGSWGAWQDAS